MELNFEVLLKYMNTFGPSTIALDISNPNEPTIKVQRGLYHECSSVRVHLLINDINNILLINGITGENGKIKNILNGLETNDSNNPSASTIDGRIEDCIYGTLGKYLTQMVYASQGKSSYPEIVYLEKHSMYFP